MLFRSRDSRELFPAYGSIADRFAPPPAGVPGFVAFPHQIADGSITPGQHGSFLGKVHDPLFVGLDPAQPGFKLPELSLPEGVDPARLARREEARALVDAMEKAVKANDAPAYHLLNLQFHDRLVEMAGNRKLSAIYRKLTKELSLFRRRNLAQGAALPVSASEHRHIVKAIASGDADAAGRALFDHVMESKSRTLDYELRRQRAAPSIPSTGKKPRADR